MVLACMPCSKPPRATFCSGRMDLGPGHWPSTLMPVTAKACEYSGRRICSIQRLCTSMHWSRRRFGDYGSSRPVPLKGGKIVKMIKYPKWLESPMTEP
ncbi:hypothetical protein I7I53_01735 [Histoplasma capsulatum var. duboisii H88]|nr:hypothetical protein I7I53_01735 [Histoplasma capsulatum var. duboisii H88]